MIIKVLLIDLITPLVRNASTARMKILILPTSFLWKFPASNLNSSPCFSFSFLGNISKGTWSGVDIFVSILRPMSSWVHPWCVLYLSK